jgi:hypothetical protein
MRAVELLGERADDLGARRVGEALELAQVFVERLARARALERRANEERPLDRRGDGDQVACDVESRDESWLAGVVVTAATRRRKR